MKFKLNAFEKFVIRNFRFLTVIYLVTLILLSALSSLLDDEYSVIASFLILVVAISGLFIIGIQSKKAKEITELCNIAIDMNSALDACNQMIEATGQKNTTFMANYCISRIVCLINIGDFERAENEIRLFWQHFNLKKLIASDLALTHILMANIALEKEDAHLFNEEMRIVNEYGNNSELVGIFKRLYFYNLNGINLYVEAFCANKNSNAQDFEARVFAHLGIDETTGKQRKKAPSPMSYFSAYNKLFVFYKRKSDTEKATYFAQQLVNIGNEQLIDYRKAKEYLENENRSN